MVGALGVVFGDIGTSPIYTIQTVFNPADPHPVPISRAWASPWRRSHPSSVSSWAWTPTSRVS